MSHAMQAAPLLKLIGQIRTQLSVTQLLRAGCAGLWWSSLVLATVVILHHTWLPLPKAVGLLLAALPLLASLFIQVWRGRPRLGQVARLADRRLQASGLLLSAWDLVQAHRQGGTGAQSLVLGRAMTALPAWQTAIRREFPVSRPQTLALAVLVNCAAAALLLSGAPPATPSDNLRQARSPSLPRVFAAVPAPEAAGTAASEPALAAGAAPANSPAAGPHSGDNPESRPRSEHQATTQPSSDRQADAGKPGATQETAMSIDAAVRGHSVRAADQVGDSARGADAASEPAAAMNLQARYVDIQRQSAGTGSADTAMPGRELAVPSHAVAGSRVPTNLPPARAPQLPAAHSTVAPALQAFVTDFLKQTQAMVSQ